MLLQATELLIAGLRKEFDIEDDVHEEILDSVMNNTERPRKRCKAKHVYYHQGLSHPGIPMHCCTTSDLHLCLVKDVSMVIGRSWPQVNSMSNPSHSAKGLTVTQATMSQISQQAC